jgi:hypothetical protein
MSSSLSPTANDRNGVSVEQPNNVDSVAFLTADDHQLTLPRKRGRPRKAVEDFAESSSKLARLQRSSDGKWQLSSLDETSSEDHEITSVEKPATDKRRVGRPRKEGK